MRTLQRWSPRNKTHIKKNALSPCISAAQGHVCMLPYMCALVWTVWTLSVCGLYVQCMSVSGDLKLQSREKMLSQPHGEKQWQFSLDNKNPGSYVRGQRKVQTLSIHTHITHTGQRKRKPLTRDMLVHTTYRLTGDDSVTRLTHLMLPASLQNWSNKADRSLLFYLLPMIDKVFLSSSVVRTKPSTGGI